jgi:solute carrier family 25 phosphate transporter 3
VPTLVGYFIQGSIKYGLFELLKPRYTALIASSLYAPSLGALDGGGGHVAVLLLAGVSAELVASIFLCPLEAARIQSVQRQQQETSSCSSSPSFSSPSPPLALPFEPFAGLAAILAKQVPYTAAQLTTYEVATTALYARSPLLLLSSSSTSSSSSSSPLLFLVSSAACASLAAVVSSLLSQPGDSILSEVNRRKSESVKNRGGDNNNNNYYYSDDGDDDDEGYGGDGDGDKEERNGLLSVAASLGFRGLFRGTQARLVQMLAIVVVQLLVYDSIKAFVGLPVTGAQ